MDEDQPITTEDLLALLSNLECDRCGYRVNNSDPCFTRDEDSPGQITFVCPVCGDEQSWTPLKVN